jgi:hypothetical protein
VPAGLEQQLLGCSVGCWEVGVDTSLFVAVGQSTSLSCQDGAVAVVVAVAGDVAVRAIPGC